MVEIERVRDEVVELNTAQSMKAEVVTKKINGTLRAFIISTDNPVHVNISIDRLPLFPFEKTQFTIYENIDFRGEEFIPIKVLTQTTFDGRPERVNYQSADWYLNDKLRVFVRGGKNTNVKVIVRYSI